MKKKNIEELESKVESRKSKDEVEAPVHGDATLNGENGVRTEAISALTMLGFATAASGKAVDKILKAEPTASVESVIRQALKML